MSHAGNVKSSVFTSGVVYCYSYNFHALLIRLLTLILTAFFMFSRQIIILLQYCIRTSIRRERHLYTQSSANMFTCSYTASRQGAEAGEISVYFDYNFTFQLTIYQQPMTIMQSDVDIRGICSRTAQSDQLTRCQPLLKTVKPGYA